MVLREIGEDRDADLGGVETARGGWPMPRVPTTAQGRPAADSSWAIHQALEVLPLVPVKATTSSTALGSA